MDNIISHDHAQFPNYSKLCTEQVILITQLAMWLDAEDQVRTYS